MSARYPAYDVLSKRRTPSWNEVTRRAIDARLAAPPGPRFFTEAEWATLRAVCARILPQPNDRPAIPLASYVDQKMFDDRRDGYRLAVLPAQGEAWKRGLAAIGSEAQGRHGRAFADLPAPFQDDLLRAVQEGRVSGAAWEGLPPQVFFTERVVADITRAYYSHPAAWNEMGFGGPASPRGYVRMDFGQRDPWEAAEAKPGRDRARAARENRRVGAG